MKMKALCELVGLADPIEPASMQYEARAAKSCDGCAFQGQKTAVCRRATELALRAGMADCDHGFIYVERKIDPRQIDLVGAA